MNRVRQIREMKGMNQRQLAERTHTPQSLVSSIERGVIKPWLKVMKRLSKALKVPARELFPEEWS